MAATAVVELDGASDNLVEGDFIGTDATGTIALGNAQAGVEIDALTVLPPTTRSAARRRSRAT